MKSKKPRLTSEDPYERSKGDILDRERRVFLEVYQSLVRNKEFDAESQRAFLLVSQGEAEELLTREEVAEKLRERTLERYRTVKPAAEP